LGAIEVICSLAPLTHRSYLLDPRHRDASADMMLVLVVVVVVVVEYSTSVQFFDYVTRARSSIVSESRSLHIVLLMGMSMDTFRDVPYQIMKIYEVGVHDCQDSLVV
jgi:hypothetical protein